MRKLKQFAVGTAVRITNPGLKGVVTRVDDDISVMGEYWHTIRTKHGEQREPGCNLELIPEPISEARRTEHLTQHINIHGPNARVNTNSTDNSVNVVMHEQMFVQMRDVAATIEDGSDRAKILTALEQLQSAQGPGGFLAAYQKFISAAADYMTLFGPFLPALAQMLLGR